MSTWYELTLSKGSISKDLYLKYLVSFEPDGQYPTISEKNNNVKIHPSFMLKFDYGYQKPQLSINWYLYFQFVTIFRKSIKIISENFHEIFPESGRTEFEIDSKTLERFQTEKAVSTAGISIMPAVYVDEQSQCFPGIRISMERGSIIIPFEDAVAFSEVFGTVDPMVLQLSILRLIGKFE